MMPVQNLLTTQGKMENNTHYTNAAGERGTNGFATSKVVEMLWQVNTACLADRRVHWQCHELQLPRFDELRPCPCVHPSVIEVKSGGVALVARQGTNDAPTLNPSP